MLVTAFDPFVQVGFFFADHGGVTVASEYFGVLWQWEDFIFDGLDDGIEVRVRPSGCTGSTIEQGVTGEQDATFELWCVEDHAAGGVARRMDRGEGDTGDVEGVSVTDVAIRLLVGVGRVPEHLVIFMNQNWSIDHLAKLDDLGNVVVVTVGQQDSRDAPATDGFTDLVDLVRRINDNDAFVIPDNVDVVVNIVRLTVK